jgi:hypothetical protein
VYLNGNFRAKDSWIRNKMAGKSPTQMPQSLRMDSWPVTTQDFGKMFSRRRDSQLLASFLARTISLAQFCTITKSPICDLNLKGEWNFSKKQQNC